MERLSGPIIDRMDLCVEVPRLAKGELFAAPQGDDSATGRERVEGARAVQRERLRPHGLLTNAEIPPRLLGKLCRRTREAVVRLERSIESMGLSARGAHRLLRVARTISDLDGEETISDGAIIEAGQYRLQADRGSPD